jgi:hypothetical protein
MSVTVLPNENIAGAKAALREHEKLEQNWKQSEERVSAMKAYPGEHIAVRNKQVIEHFDDMDLLFKALRERRSKGESLLEIVTDRMMPSPKTTNEIRAFFKDFPGWVTRDPVKIEERELGRRANAITLRELRRPFTI